MTEITIYRDAGKSCLGFRMSGHAGYKEHGEDIVCSAISILAINTMNAIEKFTGLSYTRDTDELCGIIDYRISGAPSKETDLLLNTMILGLKTIAEDEVYADYINLEYEEV